VKTKEWHFKCAQNFFLAEITAQWYEGGGRILLDDRTSGGAVLLQPIRFQCVGVRISTGISYKYIHNWPYVQWYLG